MVRSAGGGPRQPLSAKKPGKAAQKVALVNAVVKPAVKKATRRMTKTNGQKPSQRAALVSRSPKTKADKLAIATVVLERLKAEYPDAHCELDYRNPFELLCATILSAQCTDVRVNMVTPHLFARYPDAESLRVARQEDVEEIVRTTGFFRAKAKSLIGMGSVLVERHGGEVPRTVAELVPLPGVGRKTANVVLNMWFHHPAQAVDTHLFRVGNRTGIAPGKDELAVERAIEDNVPVEYQAHAHHWLILHGRYICTARSPKCSLCPIHAFCLFKEKT